MRALGYIINRLKGHLSRLLRALPVPVGGAPEADTITACSHWTF